MSLCHIFYAMLIAYKHFFVSFSLFIANSEQSKAYKSGATTFSRLTFSKMELIE